MHVVITPVHMRCYPFKLKATTAATVPQGAGINGVSGFAYCRELAGLENNRWKDARQCAEQGEISEATSIRTSSEVSISPPWLRGLDSTMVFLLYWRLSPPQRYLPHRHPTPSGRAHAERFFIF
ncbi:hypothetical protein Mapa_014664 [Marchantia paleacea]|nr:hypothetical protein Mapa_014664 [Marchantia paleacea]